MYVSFLLMNWRCTCNIVAIGYFIDPLKLRKHPVKITITEHLFLCHVCDVQSGCDIRKDLTVMLHYSSSAVMQGGVRVRTQWLLKINCLVVDVMQ